MFYTVVVMNCLSDFTGLHCPQCSGHAVDAVHCPDPAPVRDCRGVWMGLSLTIFCFVYISFPSILRKISVGVLCFKDHSLSQGRSF